MSAAVGRGRSAPRLAVAIPLAWLLMLTGGAVGEDEVPLFVSTPGPGGSAVIRVDATRRGAPISRRLFGKFTEHLHRNIYHGMWSQIVRNTSFEDWKYFFSNDESLERARAEARRRGAPWPDGLAAHWLSEGSGKVEYSLSRDAVNSETAQKIDVRELAAPEVGIRQDDVYLPLHRETDYAVRVHLRSAGIDTVTLTIRDGDRRLGSVDFAGLDTEWRRYEAPLRLAPTQRGAPLALSLTARRPGELWVDQLLVFPGDHVHGFDRDVVELCRSARLSLLRYPGGNFVSGYHWEDGAGPVDRRPMRRNPAWNCPEYNHVGTDEFLAFCEAVGCEPLICVNAGDGTPEEAARWVEYCNGSIETPQGARRARNGHPRPYGVRYWEIGNELYGGWQVGHCSAEEYARRYRRFVDAMRRVDPDLLLIANGHDADWHAPLLAAAPELVRSFSLHPLIGGGIPRTASPENVYRSLLAYPTWYAGHLERLASQMRRANVEPRLAITELQIFTNKRELPTNGTLAEAVYMARYFHMAMRLGGLVEMLTHSALVNHGGGLRKQQGVVYAQPSWWATHLYGTIDGTVPLGIEVSTPVYSVSERSMPEVRDAPYVDAVALADEEQTVLTLMMVNTHPDGEIPVKIDLHGWARERPAAGTLVGRRIGGPSFMAENRLEDPDRVTIRPISENWTSSDGMVPYRCPPHSITELVFRR